MKKTIAQIILTVLFCVLLSAQAPDPHKKISQLIHDSWQVKEGLPQNSVNAIVQTRDGYLWIGTYEGLVRFNGVSFTVFDRSTTPELLSNRIMSLCEDKKRRLWIGTYGGGLLMYDGMKFHSPVRDSSVGKYINLTSMTIDSTNRLWLITENGVIVLNNLNVVKIFPRSLFKQKYPSYITTDRNGRVWIWSLGALYLVEADSLRQIRPRTAVSQFTAPVPAKDGGIWTTEGVSPKSVRLVHVDSTVRFVSELPDEIKKHGVYPVMEDSRGTLWSYSSIGIAKYSAGTWDVADGRNNFATIGTISFLEDREQSIWFGTNGGGLHRLRDANFTPIGTPEGLTQDNVWAVFEDSQYRRWVGTLWGEFFLIDSAGIHKPKNIVPGIYFCFLEDRDHTVWLGGNLLLDSSSRLNKANPLFAAPCMTLDSAGRVWLAPENSNLRIVEHGKIVDSLSLADDFDNSTVRSMITDGDGSIWIGTQKGLFHYADRSLRRYTTADGLPNNWIRSMYQDRNGVLWCATDGGLGKKVGDKFFSYTSRDGLYSNTIHVVLEDDSSRLWMSSNKGIFVVKKEDLLSFDEKKITHIPCDVYGELDGMRSAEGNGSYQQGGWRMHDGTMWFATIKGVVIVDPNHVQVNNVSPPVFIEKITADGILYPAAGRIEFHYPLHELSFQFAALSYRIPSRVKYRYMIEGFHESWIDVGNQQTANFSNLPSGEYTFRVIACNDDGVWNTAGASVSFTLIPPFWKTWWFYSLAVLFVFGSIAGGIRLLEMRRIKRRIEQLEREKTLERERARISQDMHDEVGSNLTKISILSELANRGSEEEKKKMLEKISMSAREVIDNISHIIWAVDPKNDTLENTVAYIREYVSETLEVRSMRLVFEIPDEIPDAVVIPEFRRNIFLTMKEAINNIVKYAQAQNIRIVFSFDGSTVRITIADDGIGFVTSETSRFGNGLHNMKKRIEQIGGEWSISSAVRQGTTITFSAPITTFM
ncbi:MAG: two-component regulator propeller domain-containing protein [Bacteroidota bacterium]|jgi:signal transduction histidine kinase/ligand-binding sensor domain-containing protein